MPKSTRNEVCSDTSIATRSESQYQTQNQHVTAAAKTDLGTRDSQPSWTNTGEYVCVSSIGQPVQVVLGKPNRAAKIRDLNARIRGRSTHQTTSSGS